MMTEELKQQPITSPVHPALLNPDVLNEVFRHLSPIRDHKMLARTGLLPLVISDALPYNDPQVPVKRKSLMNAAQACKAFSEPASSALWEAIVDGFWPLLCPFPTFRMDYASSGITQNDPAGDPTGAPRESINEEIETFLQGISPAHWLIWERCARRVRFLAVRDGSDNLTLVSSFLHILMAKRQTAASHPFPGLQTLLFDETGGDSTRVQLLRLLSLAPSLSAICIHSTRTSLMSIHDLSDDLELLSQSYLPGTLQILHASCEMCHPQGRIDDLRNVRLFRRLQTFRADNLAPLAFDLLLPQLADLAELQNLYLSLLSPICYYDTSPHDDEDRHESIVATPKLGMKPSSQYGFRALKQLHVSGEPRKISQILTCVESSTLGDIALFVTLLSSADILPMLTDLASRSAIFMSLRKLRVHYDIKWDWSSSQAIRAGETSLLHTPLFDTLGPLLQLRALEDLWLQSDGRVFAITDMDITAIGEAWPYIRKLTVISHPSHEAPAKVVPLLSASRPSFSSLVHLAMRCQSLEELLINSPPRDMSEDDVDALEEFAAAGRSNITPQSRLRRLTPAAFYDPHWLELSLSDVDRLAMVLHHLFPSLDDLVDVPEFRFYKENLLRIEEGAEGKLEHSDIFKLFARIAALG
ncbi:hypothetical protein ONZ51_g1989 [Trametes cubensis]|uniref:Uncharacterized protein n=1 Tax=Trametes cubensis TaxID=1111947 RepID=A0AAD7XEY7_9APHY|nr:hypothetical protein ONZ51_g1989 [Trametes cubensis]